MTPSVCFQWKAGLEAGHFRSGATVLISKWKKVVGPLFSVQVKPQPCFQFRAPPFWNTLRIIQRNLEKYGEVQEEWIKDWKLKSVQNTLAQVKDSSCSTDAVISFGKLGTAGLSLVITTQISTSLPPAVPALQKCVHSNKQPEKASHWCNPTAFWQGCLDTSNRNLHVPQCSSQNEFSRMVCVAQ